MQSSIATTNYDILICGGGLVGAAFAIAMEQRGFTVAVVESKQASDRYNEAFDSRALALSPGSQAILQDLNVWQDIAAQSIALEKVHVSRRGNFGSHILSAKKEGLSALGFVVNINQLKHALATRCEASPKIAWLCPATVTAIEADDENATVTILQNDKQQTVHASLAILAEGSDLTLAKSLGFSFTEHNYHRQAYIFNVQVDNSEKTAYERFTKHGPLAMLPMPDNRYKCVWVLPTGVVKAYEKLDDEMLLEKIQATFGYRLGRFRKLGKRLVYPLHFSYARKQTAHRLVLLGNAAHTMHPVAGQGYNLSLRDVDVLAQVLMQAGDDFASEKTLEIYEKKRHADQLFMTTFTHQLLTPATSESRIASIIRSAAFIALDNCSLVRKSLLRQTLGFTTRGDLHANV